MSECNVRKMIDIISIGKCQVLKEKAIHTRETILFYNEIVHSSFN